MKYFFNKTFAITDFWNKLSKYYSILAVKKKFLLQTNTPRNKIKLFIISKETRCYTKRYKVFVVRLDILPLVCWIRYFQLCLQLSVKHCQKVNASLNFG